LRRQIQLSLVEELESVEHSETKLIRELRALQLSGMTDVEIRIFIERERVQHELAGNDGQFDDAAIEALDLITGLRRGLDLTPAAHCAAALKPQFNAHDFRNAIDRAFEASDLLPVNRLAEIRDSVKEEIAWRLAGEISEDAYRAVQAHFTRAPKRRFVSRPAASLALQDRVVYQALADAVETRLGNSLPEAVLWPRPGSSSREANARFQSISDTWDDASFEVSADIESYFEYIDHSLLAYILTTFLGMPDALASALETFLDVVMDSSRGLPQGPVASDILATVYLLPLDKALEDRGWKYARYQDDIKVAADGIADAKNTMRELEQSLRDFGLRLATDKSHYVSLAKRVRQEEEYVTETAQDRAAAARKERDRLDPTELLGEFRGIAEQVFNKTPGDSAKTSELKLRRILTKLAAGTGDGVSPRDLARALDWFPQLAPEVAQYLGQRFIQSPEEVAEFIKFRLSKRRELDWENAWIVLAPDLGGDQLSPDLEGMFVAASRDRAQPPLTRCNLLKVLIRRGQLEKPSLAWAEGVPRALMSELFLDTHQDPRGGGHSFAIEAFR
jgi:hypothetical protein